MDRLYNEHASSLVEIVDNRARCMQMQELVDAYEEAKTIQEHHPALTLNQTQQKVENFVDWYEHVRTRTSMRLQKPQSEPEPSKKLEKSRVVTKKWSVRKLKKTVSLCLKRASSWNGTTIHSPPPSPLSSLRRWASTVRKSSTEGLANTSVGTLSPPSSPRQPRIWSKKSESTPSSPPSPTRPRIRSRATEPSTVLSPRRHLHTIAEEIDISHELRCKDVTVPAKSRRHSEGSVSTSFLMADQKAQVTDTTLPLIVHKLSASDTTDVSVAAFVPQLGNPAPCKSLLSPRRGPSAYPENRPQQIMPEELAHLPWPSQVNTVGVSTRVTPVLFPTANASVVDISAISVVGWTWCGHLMYLLSEIFTFILLAFVPCFGMACLFTFFLTRLMSGMGRHFS